MKITSLLVTLALSLPISACNPPPDNAEISEEIRRVQDGLKLAQTDAAKYGGALQSLAQLRAAILQNTIAMLEQRRDSWLFFVPSTYQARDLQALSSEVGNVDDLRADIELAEARLKSAQEEAAKYSGGLLQSVALVRVATEQVTVAGLHQRSLFGKWNIPLLIATGGEVTKKPPPAGPIVPDDEAL